MGDKKLPGKGQAEGFSHCKFKGCKHHPSKFEFCSDHFDQFKFGLITKTGEYCPDYEKKLDQYNAKKKKAA
jgi:hypothetical protein